MGCNEKKNCPDAKHSSRAFLDLRSKRIISAVVAAALALNGIATAQMQDPAQWVNYELVLGVKNGQRNYDFQAYLTESSVKANILWPGEQPHYLMQVLNHLSEPWDVSGKIDIIQIGARARSNDIWLPEMVKIRDVQSIPIDLSLSANGYADRPVDVRIPEEFGDYALVLDLGEHGRSLITCVARTFAASPERIRFPKQSLDDIGPDNLQRLGIQAIRMGMDYVPTTFVDYRQRMEELDKEMASYRKKNITVLMMFGAGPDLMPLGTPRSFLDSNGIMLNTKQDYVWLPSQDEDFKKFVRELCLKYGWPKGPVTAVSLWNEPWEGISISGWQSDMLRYREIYKKMAEAVVSAREQGAEVLVGGGDSGSNAWDKLFPDGKMDLLPIFDFCSIHYQGMEAPSIYPQWINRQSPNGRVKIWDTESWVANTDDRIGLVIAANRSAGYDRNMGIFGGYLFSGGHGDRKQKVSTSNGVVEKETIPMAWPQAAALGAAQHMIGERDFKELLFKKGLPWIMLFDGLHQDPDDGTAVICGDIGEAFGKSNVLFRSITLRPDARMIVPADPRYRLSDFYGNPILPVKGKLVVPLGSYAYYLRTNGANGSFRSLVEALKQARIEGYDAVEMIPKDLTRRIEDHPVMELKLTNILNRPVKGTLDIKFGDLKVDFPHAIALKPFETREVGVQILGGTATDNNTYPLVVTFNAGTDGATIHREDMHVNLISRLSVKVDGNLDEWEGALPQTVSANGEANISSTEAAWYPFKNFSQSANGYANGYLAYDDQNFYFACKAADKTPHPGTYRFSTRNDDEFFYPDTAWQTDPSATLAEILDSARGKGEMKYYWRSKANTNSYGLDLRLPSGKSMRVAFYLPNLDAYQADLEIYDQESGELIASQHIDKLWDGAYESYRLSGHLRIVFHSNDWWYTVKLGSIFFDSSEEAQARISARFLGEDLDTKDSWQKKYGGLGNFRAGFPPELPTDVALEFADTVQKTALVWPAGVRHFTYRKDPVLPDNSGLGFSFDNVQIAFNAIPVDKDELLPNPPGTMPGYTGYKCTDYEYALNQVDPKYGGGTEIWRLLIPGMNRKHFFPRQPKSPHEGAVENGQLAIRREGNTLITECAIPWSEIPDVKKALDIGGTVKFSFRVNDDGSPNACMELAKDRSVSKQNARAFHPDWQVHWANELEFGFEK